MVDICQTPLKENYYNVEGWVQSLVGFYGGKKQLLPEAVLTEPIEMLAGALYSVTEIYGNFPEIVYNALGQTIDPMFSPEEYYKKIYTVLKTAGVDENRPGLVEYADGLLAIRYFFQRDKKFHEEFFADAIAQTPGDGAHSKYEKFTSVMQDITKIHVNQIRRMLAERKE